MPDPVPGTRAECRQRADEIERFAAMPAMEANREAFLSIAANWRKIADDIEATARRDPMTAEDAKRHHK
jgi:hypothetical protein